MKRILLSLVLLIALMPALAHAQSVFDGTWKYDFSKLRVSKKPYVYLLKDGIYESQSSESPFKVKADGTDQPVSGYPSFNTVAVRVASDRELEVTEKKDGKVVHTSIRTVSSDGKTLSVKFTDTSKARGSPPVTTRLEYARVAEGPAGSHAISGSWEMTNADVSDDGATFTLRIMNDAVSFSTPTADSYIAKLDGTEAAYNGDPDITSVSVKMQGNDTLVETFKRDGKVIWVSTLTVAADGKSLKEIDEIKLSDRRIESIAVKQPGHAGDGPDVIARLIGTWKGHDVLTRPDSKEEFDDKSTCTWAVPDKVIEWQEHDSTGTTEFLFAGYDPKKQAYLYAYIDSDGSSSSGIGNWDKPTDTLKFAVDRRADDGSSTVLLFHFVDNDTFEFRLIVTSSKGEVTFRNESREVRTQTKESAK